MISCAKEVLYIVYIKRLQYLLETSCAVFINKTLHSNLVALTYRKNVPPNAVFIERRQEVVNLSHSFFVSEMQECGGSLQSLELNSHHLEFKVTVTRLVSFVRQFKQCHFMDKGGLEALKISYLRCTKTYSELYSFSLRLYLQKCKYS